MTSSGQATVLAVDLGKTSCRARVTCGETVIGEAHGAGAPGLAEAGGADLAYQAIVATLGSLGDALVHTVSYIGIGAAGAATAPHAAADLSRRLRALIDVPIAVLSDALAAHAGAFGGGAGTALIAGTGAVVFTVSGADAHRNEIRQVDGWGPWLGDEGGGRWIGQIGLQCALRAHDGRGPATTLLADAKNLVGDVARLPVWVSESGEPARRLGSFAPTVIARAETGDAVALNIVGEATRLLAATCAAASETSVCVIGGLATQPFFAAQLTAALEAAGLREVAALGDPLDGAALVATEHSLPYETRTTRG